MKIAIITSIYGISGGGAGIAAEQLAQALAGRGWDVGVITVEESKKNLAEANSKVRVIELPLHNLYPLRQKDQHPVWQKIIWQIVDIFNPFTARDLRKILLKEKPDVIHIHKMRGFSGAVWTVSSQICPGRVIQTCHDFESMSPAGTLQGRIGKWALEGKWPIRWYQTARAYFSRNVTRATAPSSFTLATIAKSGLFPSAKCEVIPNTHGWTVSELDKIRQNSNQSENMHILFLGRLEPEKGLRELCSAFCSVVSRYPELHLTIAGWGSLEAELRQVYGSCPEITITGKIFGEEKNRLLSSITALILPSTCQEAFGTVVIEGYAYGKPVIASKIGGLSELVHEGKTGWFVEPGNSDALEQAIEAVVQNPTLLHKMATNCYEAAKAFTIDEMIEKYEEVYKDVTTGL
jgi:glycosyltransferase involved in cell wall biosynthesis